MHTTPKRNRGVTLAMVLVAAVIATLLWANSYSVLQQQVKMQERSRHGYTGHVPDKGTAASWAIACLRANLPNTSGDPPTAQCKLVLGAGANQRTFGIKYIDRSGGVWDIEITEGDPGWTACTSCPGAGGPQ
jgi:hypothetical protein